MITTLRAVLYPPGGTHFRIQVKDRHRPPQDVMVLTHVHHDQEHQGVLIRHLVRAVTTYWVMNHRAETRLQLLPRHRPQLNQSRWPPAAGASKLYNPRQMQLMTVTTYGELGGIP